ncbi:MAG: type II and III secretion system family protein [Mariprofundus sp.]|nr:type II and III secretion system family protein [Mariprofundus sp.]
MNRPLASLVFNILCWFCLTVPVFAATDIIEVYFLPMQEAADVARSQLSANGKVAVIPSRHMLLIDDDPAYIQKAKAWLKRLDHPPGQYTAYVSIEDIRSGTNNISNVSGYVVLGQLAGGWLKVKLRHQQFRSGQRQSFQLRISSNHSASIETGVIRSYSRETRLWLSRYGVIYANNVELIPVTSGFNITATPAGTDQVRVKITPWMKRVAESRLVSDEYPVIEIAGASTELVMPVDTSVTIAASNQEAGKLATALLSSSTSTGKRQFVIHLRVSKQ